MNIITLFCKIDDFFLAYEKWVSTQCLPETPPLETRGRPRQLHPSEVMTLLIAFHQSNYRTFKHFYLKHACVYWRAEFPHLVSYTRFVQLKKEVLTLLVSYLSTTLGDSNGVSFVDSTRLRVCDNKRISSHRVFADVAERSKTSMGWFYGFKLHLIINDTGELLDVALTPGNTDDRKPLWGVATEGSLHGSLYGDRGYISKDLREKLRKQGVNLVYKVRKNMKPLDLSVSDEVLLKKRMLIESVIRELKTQMQVEHTRHRSFVNFQVNVFSALIAYHPNEGESHASSFCSDDQFLYMSGANTKALYIIDPQTATLYFIANWYYTQMPEGFRPHELGDILNIEKNSRGNIWITGIAFDGTDMFAVDAFTNGLYKLERK